MPSEIATKDHIRNLINADKTDEAKASLSRYLSEHSPDAETSIFEATLCFSSGSPEDAKKAIVKGLALSPLHYELYYMLGGYYEQKKNAEAALLCAAHALFLCSSEEDLPILQAYQTGLEERFRLTAPKTAILIPVHNQLAYLKLCLEYIHACCDMSRLQIIVIDNASSDGLSQWALAQPDLSCVRSEKLLTLGAAYNLGREHTDEPSDLFLAEPSVLMMPNVLFQLKMALYTQEQAGAAEPLDNTDIKNKYPGLTEKLADFIPVAAAHNAYLCASPRRILGLAKHCVLLRADLARQMRFHEDFFIWENWCKNLSLDIVSKGFYSYSCPDSCLFAYPAPSYYFEPELYEHSALSDFQAMEKRWKMHYFNLQPSMMVPEFIDFDPALKPSVLEIGCDCGCTLMEIKNRYPLGRVFGLELNPNAAAIAGRFADVLVGNIEDRSLPYLEHSFDCILFGDVLEHLHDPESTLKYLRAFLKPQGRIIVSVPNICHISVIRQLLHGSFTYEETGLLDRTHIHFFTRKELLSMLSRAGFELEKLRATYQAQMSREERQLIDSLALLEPGIDAQDFKVFQYLASAKPM